jgi:MFS family permease
MSSGNDEVGVVGGSFSSLREVLRGNVLVITMGTVISQLSLFITFPFFSLYVRALGGSMVDIGIANALRPVAAMFIYPIAGALADSYSRVRILVVTGVLNATIIAIYLVAPDWRYLAAANFLNGLLVFRFPASSALLADSMDPGLRGRGFVAVSAIPGFVGIFSPFIGGYLMTIFDVELGMRILYAVSVAGTLLTALLNWRFLEDTLSKPPGSIEDLPDVVKSSYGGVLRTLRWLPSDLRFYALIIASTFFFNSLSGPYWVVYAQDIMGISVLGWGSLITLSTVIQVLISIPAGAIIDRYDKSRIAALALALSAVPALAFPFSRGFVGVILVFVPIAVANGFLMPLAGALMADMVPRERRGMVMATLGRGMLMTNIRGGMAGGGPGMGFITCLPVILGSLLGGYVFEASPVYPWLLLGSAIIVNAALAAFFLRPRG